MVHSSPAGPLTTVLEITQTMSSKESRPTNNPRYHQDRRLEEMDHDPYHARAKPREPASCPHCGAIFTRGRWAWPHGKAPAATHETSCPACLRIREGVPAAILTLEGEFFREHEAEITNLIHNYEEREVAEHPLKRIMERRERDGAVEIAFTDAHLARGTAEALHHAYGGELAYQNTRGDTLLRATWRR